MVFWFLELFLSYTELILFDASSSTFITYDFIFKMPFYLTDCCENNFKESLDRFYFHYFLLSRIMASGLGIPVSVFLYF